MKKVSRNWDKNQDLDNFLTGCINKCKFALGCRNIESRT